MKKRRKSQGKWRKIEKTPIFSLRLAPCALRPIYTPPGGVIEVNMTDDAP
jgi:hypothetical protein